MKLKPAARIKIALAQRGMTLRDLARECGYVYGTIRNVASGGHSTKRARAKVEEVLGVAIWGAGDEV